MQDAQQDDLSETRSGTQETQNIDYSQQLAQIQSDIEDLIDAQDINSDIYDKLSDLNTEVGDLNDNILTLSSNISFAFRLQTGILVALWASLIAYIAFSKIR